MGGARGNVLSVHSPGRFRSSDSSFCQSGGEIGPGDKNIRRYWKNINWENVNIVSESGHRIKLYYPESGERKEIVTRTVDSLDLTGKIKNFNRFDLTMLILNTGNDLKFSSWRKIVKNTGNLTWLDIHSLALTPDSGKVRKYRPVEFWVKWAEGVDYLQANEKEAACMLGDPDINITEKNLKKLAGKFFKLGGRAFFVTRGKKGTNLFLPAQNFFIEPSTNKEVVDTTGCGDVLGSAVACKFITVFGYREALSEGLNLASETAGVAGPGEVHKMITRIKNFGEN